MAFEYANTNPKLYLDLGCAIAGSTPGAGGVPYCNTNPKAYIDAEITAAGGTPTGTYANTSPRAYIDASLATTAPVDPPDTTPPNTTITGGPTGTTADNTPTFTFSSSESPATYEVKMDGGAWEPCPVSQKTYDTLADGAHTFQVRAIDQAGNVDASPASQAFTIETESALPPSGMSLLWSGTEISDWSATLIEDAPGASITEVDDYILFDMPTPSSASGDRVELQKTGIFDPDGGEYYYTWEFYIDSSVAIPAADADGYVTINQFHGNENAGYSGGFGIHEDGELHVRIEGGYRMDSNDYEYEVELNVGDFEFDTWHTIGYHVKWDMSYAGIAEGSTNESPTGFAIAYLDGVEGARVEGVPTMGDKRTGPGRIAGTGPTDNVMFRVGWYPQIVGPGGYLMRVRNVEAWS